MFSHITKIVNPLTESSSEVKVFLIDHIRFENLKITISTNNLTHYLMCIILETEKDTTIKELLVIAFEDNILQIIAIE